MEYPTCHYGQVVAAYLPGIKIERRPPGAEVAPLPGIADRTEHQSMWARQERFLQNHGVWIDMPRAMKDRMPMLEIKMLDSAKKTPSGHRDLIFKDFTVCRLAPLVRVAEQNPPKDEPVETYMTGDAFDKKFTIENHFVFSASVFFQFSNSRFQWRDVPNEEAQKQCMAINAMQ